MILRARSAKVTVTHRCNRHPAHHVTSRSCFALRVRESCSPGTSTTYAQQSHADWRLGSTRSGSCRDATAAQQIPSCLRSLPAPGELAARLNNARLTPPSQESGHPLGPAPATHPPGPGFDVTLRSDDTSTAVRGLPGPHPTTRGCLLHIAHHDGLQPTQHVAV